MSRQRDKWVTRVIAWMLSFAMAVSLVVIPSDKTEAAGETIALSYSTDQVTASGNVDNQVSLDLGNGGYSDLSELKSAGLTKLRVSFEVSSADGTGNIGGQAFVNAKGTWKGEWINVNAGSGTQTVELDLTQFYSKSGQLYNFGFQFENVTSITYKIKEAVLVNSGSSSGGDSGSGSDSSDFGTEREYSSGVTATVKNQGTPSNDWSGFEMAISNNTGASICDWIVVLQVPSGTASAFKCWNATFVADGDTIYMYPMQSGGNAVLAAGTMQNDIPGGGFAAKYVDASSIQVKGVYYNKGTSSSVDYSQGDTNDNTGGSGGSGGSGGTSSGDTTTNKDLDVEFNYAKALQESLYFYDANMCGYLEDTCALSWRGNCHTYDKNVTYTKNGKTYNVDASGGFHDAGDHVKFGLPQGYAASMLGMSYYQFKDAFDELGQKEHLKKITDYFCDYFKRCTVYEGDQVIAFCYQVGDGNTDHGVWTAPEGQTISRPAFFADASNPATDEVSVVIAALALNYINFGNNEDLKTAKDLFTFVEKNNKACATEGASTFYASRSYGDDYAFAASALAAATGDTSYNSIYNEYKDNSDNGVNQYWVLDWGNTGALACMLQKDTAKIASITDVCKGKSAIDGVFNCVSDWGSCRYSAAEQFTGLVYDKLTGKTTYADWATSQMNYMLGDNPNKRCYIVGYNENSSKYPHHRAASRSTDSKIINSNHYTLLGALVGGPGANGTYKDDQGDYYCNEVALDYNAGLVGAAAGLYLVHKNDKTVKLSYAKKNATNYSTKTASAAELAAVGVKTYYGTNSGDDTEEEVKATEIKLNQETCALTEGETVTLRATVIPKTAEQKVTWKSENEKIATVSDVGKVTALAAGTTTITAATMDGTKLTASCKLTVKAAPKAVFSTDQTVLTCAPVIYGYETGSAAELVLENKGDADGTAALQLEKGAGSAFALSGDSERKLAPAGKTTVIVSLKNGKDAGTYSDNLLIEADNGQSFQIPVSATVEKCPVTGITFPTAGMIVTGQTLSESELSGGDETYGTFAWADAAEKPERGTYQGQVVLTLCSDAKKNYAFDQITGYDAAAGTITQNVTVTVSRAGLPAITFPEASELVYGQKLSDSTLAGGSTGYGTFAWSTPDVTMGEQEVENSINQYEVVFTWSDASKKQYQIENSDEDAVYKKMVSVKVRKAKQTAVPDSVDLLARTKDTIRISGQAGVRYSVDGTTWKQAVSNGETIEFAGLRSFTKYTVSGRYAETATAYAGKAVELLTVYTLVQDPYTIDIAKITDKEYQDALRTDDGKITVNYTEPVLTLTEDGRDYVITGKNKELVIKAGGATRVTLDQAEVGAVAIIGNADGKTEIARKGTVTIAGNVETDGGLVISGDGFLTVSGKISAAGDITIKGGKVSVDGGVLAGGTVLIRDAELVAGTDETGTAIKADTVRIEESKVTVGANQDTKNPPIKSDNIILAGDNTVASSSGSKDIFSSKPKDENGDEIPDTILIEKITLNKTSVVLNIGDTERIAVAAVIPANATLKTFDWKSSNEKVASVSQTGEVKGVSAGTAVITVTAKDESGVTGSCTVTIKKKETVTPTPNPEKPTTEKPAIEKPTTEKPTTEAPKKTVKPTKVKIQAATKKIAPGKKLTLKATVTPKKATNKKVKWTIRKSDKKYASINSKGVLTVKKAAKGKTIKVTATAVGNSKVKATYTVKVMKKAVKKVTITSKKKTVKKVMIKKKQSITLKAKLTPTKGISKEVTWTSGNPKVAKVTAKGKVTGKKKGTVKITAKAKDGSGKKATITIKVK
ncbi:glycoside hydrolase family 9 protein [Clostridium sp. AM54-37XD]|nr:glycoside hydrolase family 9 protein [Clostridium sp. AM54-37XD]